MEILVRKEIDLHSFITSLEQPGAVAIELQDNVIGLINKLLSDTNELQEGLKKLNKQIRKDGQVIGRLNDEKEKVYIAIGEIYGNVCGGTAKNLSSTNMLNLIRRKTNKKNKEEISTQVYPACFETKTDEDKWNIIYPILECFICSFKNECTNDYKGKMCSRLNCTVCKNDCERVANG